MVEGAQERGYLEAAELEAFAVELDLNDEEVEELTTELERIGLEIATTAAAAAAEAEREKEKEAELAAAEAAAAASGAADSLQLFLADVGRHIDPIQLTQDDLDGSSGRLRVGDVGRDREGAVAGGAGPGPLRADVQSRNTKAVPDQPLHARHPDP